MQNNLGIFIQARMGSTRLPEKIFKEIGGRPALKIMVDNLKNTQYFDRIFILTSNKKQDDKVEEFSINEKIKCFRGSENDVLDRFFQAADKYQIQDVVRLTADCPFLSMQILEDNIKGYYENNKPDYFFVKNYPTGLGAVEVINFNALKRAAQESTANHHREHVMTYLEDFPGKFKLIIKEAADKYNRPDIRLTLDEQKDLDLLRIVYQKLKGKIELYAIIDLFNREPGLLNINSDVKPKTI